MQNESKMCLCKAHYHDYLMIQHSHVRRATVTTLVTIMQHQCLFRNFAKSNPQITVEVVSDSPSSSGSM